MKATGWTTEDAAAHAVLAHIIAGCIGRRITPRSELVDMYRRMCQRRDAYAQRWQELAPTIGVRTVGGDEVDLGDVAVETFTDEHDRMGIRYLTADPEQGIAAGSAFLFNEIHFTGEW